MVFKGYKMRVEDIYFNIIKFYIGIIYYLVFYVIFIVENLREFFYWNIYLS